MKNLNNKKEKILRSFKLTAGIIAYVFIALICVSCNLTNETVEIPYSAAVTPKLSITGDVQNELILNNFADYTATVNNHTLSIPLLSILEDAVPTGNGLSVFFSSPDGVMAQIPLSEIDHDCHLSLTSENGWQFHSDIHPRQSGIKHMDKIVICAEETVSSQKCFRVIHDKNFFTLTYGQLFNAEALTFSVLEGEAKMHEATTKVYSRRTLIPLSNYLINMVATMQKEVLAYYNDGSQNMIDINGYLEWRGNSVDYIAPDKISRNKDIIGIWLAAPVASITDIAAIAIDKSRSGKVMIILLDGAGYYNLLEHAPEFLSSYSMVPMRTVMPSISNVSLAALVTGQIPIVNGVTARNMRDLLVDDIFKVAVDSGLKCAVVEGNSQIINMSIKQALNPDLNGDGYTDDEVMATALSLISEGTDFILVHFHGFDDVAHTYGPSSDQAAAKLYLLDNYVAELCENFIGTVLVTADHGQHTSANLEKIGDHGEFLPFDMTIPLIIIAR
jgi:hypothetical protein